MDVNGLTPAEATAAWDEEAAKLGGGDTPPIESTAIVPDSGNLPENPPQDEVPADNKGQPEDPFAGLPEAVRERLGRIETLEQSHSQLLQHVRTAEGRVAAMQRELMTAKAAQEVVAPQDAPSQVAIDKAAANPEKWNQLKKDFPEWADAMEEYVSSKVGAPAAPGLTTEQVEQQVSQRVSEIESKMERRIDEVYVEAKHQGWKATVNTPDFIAWYQMQTPETQALASSTDREDAVKMLDIYADSRKRSAADVKQERSRRLEVAATTRPGNTPPPKSLDDMTEAEIWAHEAAKREKTRASRGF